ncbi:MAG: histidinol-phosphatase [Nitrospira sp.]|nr:histidinol-phosphatase [Nitrospira sp.]
MTETNRALAQIFLAMADLLAVRRDNPHRIRAYRRAAESLRDLPEDVATLSQRGALQEIPGIGKDLAAKIQEYLKTGVIQSYEAIKAPLPPEIATWTTLPGLSDTVVQHLYFRLGIGTLADLETLVRSHLLRTLPGVTATEEALLDAIHARQQEENPPAGR